MGAYLPDLTPNEGVLAHYTAQFNIRQFLGTLVYLGCVLSAGRIRGTDRTIQSTVQTAKDAAGVAFGITIPFLLYAWMFLFRKRMPLSKVPEGSNLLTTGFVQVARTAKKIWFRYRALKWFMVSLLWSPEAGSGVLLSIAVTYLTVTLGLTGQELGRANLILVVMNIPGSLFAKWVVTGSTL